MLKVIKSKHALLEYFQEFPHHKNSYALVPTMGNLHAGHLELVKTAFKYCPQVIVSIFVNPTQFAPHEDFATYPRTLDADIQKLNELLLQYCATSPEHNSQKIIVFAPESIQDIYPPEHSTMIDIGPWGQELEGKIRPHHFRGVCTVVYLLLSLTKPKVAVFGKKDYQQLRIIQKMCADLLLATEIIPMETQRTPEGLALSSRNQYLSAPGLTQALQLSRTLKEAAEWIRLEFQARKIVSWHMVQQHIMQNFATSTTTATWDYLALRKQNFSSLPETNDIVAHQTISLVLLGALKIESVRLIDNLEINLP